MTIAPAMLREFPDLNDAQRDIVGHGDGPLLVIAGPGSGKTFSLVLRAMNLLLTGKVAPKELVLCTFTEKAAYELRDRVSGAAQKLGYTGDLSGLRVSTMHGFCNQVITAHRHRTPLGNNYETLDELTQLLFLFENFEEIVGPEVNGKFVGKWSTKWTAIEGLRGYFDKITEELIDPEELARRGNAFLKHVATAYMTFERELWDKNRVDFAHLQKLVWDLAKQPDLNQAITRDIKYVLVDEYQDTNYIQEQLLLKLTDRTQNLCVVGDEDQSLYRFRGATVRNILEFPARCPGCRIVKLTTNYRSHRRIGGACDRWMASADWTNPNGVSFRYDKTIQADESAEHPEYPAIFCILGQHGAQPERAVRRFGRVSEEQRRYRRLQSGGAAPAQCAATAQRAIPRSAGAARHCGVLPPGPSVLR